jgi:hypothetical protein
MVRRSGFRPDNVVDAAILVMNDQVVPLMIHRASCPLKCFILRRKNPYRLLSTFRPDRPASILMHNVLIRWASLLVFHPCDAFHPASL